MTVGERGEPNEFGIRRKAVAVSGAIAIGLGCYGRLGFKTGGLFIFRCRPVQQAQVDPGGLFVGLDGLFDI
jgi:hypothetical protein